MANLYKEIELIDTNSFMGLLATKEQIPGAVGTPIADDQRATNNVFEVVGRKPARTFGFKIVRPASWSKNFGGNFGDGAFAH